ncbi:Tudor-knot domain-containing protein [Magnetococcales bacterium HHB-1]
MARLIRIFMIALVAGFLHVSSADALGTGDRVKVKWQGKYYPAKILRSSDAQFRIRYIGYDSSWDEWVTPTRMRIQVYWKGKWYKAKARKVSGSRVYIHYTGYDNSWDEWVTLDRIRSR